MMKQTAFFAVLEGLVSLQRTVKTFISTSATSALVVGALDWIIVILNDSPWKRTEIILSILRLHPSTTFLTLVDYEGYSISSKGSLPTVVDINSPIAVHFSSLIPKMSMFTLAISCLATSNLP